MYIQRITEWMNLCTGWWRPIGCLIFSNHFPQQSPTVIGSFAENDSNWRHPMSLRHPVFISGYLFKYTSTHVHTHTHIPSLSFTHTRTFTHTLTHTPTYKHTYTRTHAHIHTRTHTHTRTTGHGLEANWDTHPPSHSLSLILAVSFSLSLFLLLSLSFSPSLSLSLSPCFSLSLSPCFSLSLSRARALSRAHAYTHSRKPIWSKLLLGQLLGTWSVHLVPISGAYSRIRKWRDAESIRRRICRIENFECALHYNTD